MHPGARGHRTADSEVHSENDRVGALLPAGELGGG